MPDHRVRYELRPESTALLVIDMQNDFLLPGSPMELPSASRIVPRLRSLTDQLRAQGVLIVFTRQSNRPDGSDLGVLRDAYPQLIGADGRLSALAAGSDGVSRLSSVPARLDGMPS